MESETSSLKEALPMKSGGTNLRRSESLKETESELDNGRNLQELTLHELSLKIQSDIDEIKTTLKILTEAIVQLQTVTGSIATHYTTLMPTFDFLNEKVIKLKTISTYIPYLSDRLI